MWCRFWIKSSRGTDKSEIVELPDYCKGDKEEIKCQLERWCSQFGCWEASENMCRYGSDDNVKPPREVIEKKLRCAKTKRKEALADIKRFKAMLEKKK